MKNRRPHLFFSFRSTGFKNLKKGLYAMAIEKAFFRQVMGRFATGVTVVTTSHGGVLAGLTVNSFTSVSLNPPLILVCIDNRSSTLPLLRESGVFVVNMLTEEQENLSRGFATNSEERFKHFMNASYHTAATGAPVLDHVLAFIDARIVAEYPGGDHAIFIGQVEAMGTNGQVTFVDEVGQEQSTLTHYNGIELERQARPLTYYQGRYHHLTDQYEAPSLLPVQERKIEVPTSR
jgi:flavin reductase (DIM6/NTAB) family NADH-FMN oxidoreductase RutF